MNKAEQHWLELKRNELKRASCYNPDVQGWDIHNFLVIVDKLQRENRRLKTQLAAKEIV